MDSEIVNNINKYYRLSKSIAGNLGDDLLHHTLITFKNKRKLTGDDLYRYFATVLRNEFLNKSSKFNKDFRQETFVEIETETTNEYDTGKLNDILQELSNKGHSIEVEVFKQAYLKSSVTDVAKKLNVSRRHLYSKYITFVKTEIKNRYEL